MSSINANATVTLTVNGKQAQDMLDGLKKKSQDLEKAIEGAAKAGNKQSLTKLQRELKQTKRQIDQIESATVGVERVLNNLDRATPKELQKTLTTLKKQLNGIERGTAEWNRQCEAIKRVKGEIDKVNMEMKEAEGRWSKFNRIVNDWQTTIMGAAAALTGVVMAGRQAVKAYAEMDAELANVRKFTGMTAEEVAALNEEFKKMDTRTSREALNQLAQEAGRLGKSSMEDVLGFVKAADQINVALDDLGEGATLTLSKLTSIFGDEAKLGTERALLAVGSVINELSQNCTASAPYLAQFAQRLAGVGAQAKMTIPEIMGFAAVLDSQGQAVEMSATALSVLITDLFKKQDQIIKATGLNAEKFKETLKRSTNEGLIMLIERLHELGNIDVLAPVFKEMGENGTRAAGVFSALAGNIDKVKWEQQEANKAFNEATSVTEEFNVQNNTVQAGLDKASKRVHDVAVELGEKLMPVMSHVISSTSLLLKAMSMTVSFIIKFKAEIIAATTVLAAYAVAVNLAAIKTKAATVAHAAHNVVIKAGQILTATYNIALYACAIAYNRVTGNATRAAAATRLFNAAIKANPIGLLITALTAAVAIVAVWQSKVRAAREENERLRKEAAKSANEIKNVESKIGEETSAVKRLKDAIDSENVGSSKRNALIQEFNNRFGPYLSKMLTEKSTAQDLAKAYEEVVKNLRAKMLLEAREKDMQERVGVRYGWEATRLSEFDKIARDNKSVMNGAWLKSVVDEVYQKQKGAGKGYTFESIQAEVFKEYAKKMMKDEYGSKEYQKANSEMQAAMGSYIRQYLSTRNQESIVTNKWKPYEDDINSLTSGVSTSDFGGDSGTVPVSTSTSTTSNKSHEDKFKAEKEWKEKEEALNRIAYATGQKNYEDFTTRMTEIEEEYQAKILSRTDLTNAEKLEAQAAYEEARKKLVDDALKRTADQENDYYNDLLATEKQRYIDGQVDRETYQNTVQLLELQHLKRMVSIYKEGTREYEQAQKAYQDRLISDQEKHQKETEQKEKEHQERLKKIKEDYFGDNPEERRKKYMEEADLLNQVYEQEMKKAGNNEEEKKRIEKAAEEARKLLKQKYNIDEDDKNWLEKAEDDVTKWLEGPGEKWKKAFEVISQSMSAIFSQLTSVIQAETEIQTAAIEKRYDAEISRAEGNNYQVKKLEKKKQEEVAKIKNEANKKMYTMQVMEAIAQTATAAINAYSSAAAIKVIGWVLAPIAAASAIAAGMIQVAAIKKQQQAAAAQGYAEGGFTGDGKRDEVAGVVHKGEWVASQRLVNSPVARPLINALEYAQRTNTIGSLTTRETSPAAVAPTVVVQQSPAQSDSRMEEVLRLLTARLEEPFVTVNTVEGDHGIKQAQDDYDKMIRNKTPKSRR